MKSSSVSEPFPQTVLRTALGHSLTQADRVTGTLCAVGHAVARKGLNVVAFNSLRPSRMAFPLLLRSREDKSLLLGCSYVAISISGRNFLLNDTLLF